MFGSGRFPDYDRIIRDPNFKAWPLEQYDIRGHFFIDSKCTILYTPPQVLLEVTMKISISEARRRLPELVRQVRKDAGRSVQITVHDEVVAELRAALPEPEPGAAAKKLLGLMEKLPKHSGRKISVSAHVKEHLYVRSRLSR